MASRKKLFATRAKELREPTADATFMSTSEYNSYVIYPPSINFETADFDKDPMAFVEQFIICGRRPEMELGERPGEAYFTGNDEDFDKNRLTSYMDVRTREFGEPEGPHPLRHKETAGISLPNPADSDKLGEELAKEELIQTGALMPQWNSDEDPELMTAMWEKDQQFAKEAIAMFQNSKKILKTRELLREYGNFYAKDATVGVCYLPPEMVNDAENGEYSLRMPVPKEFEEMLAPAPKIDVETLVSSEELETVLLGDWKPPKRTYEQKEVDRRELAENWAELFLKHCLYCEVNVIRSFFGRCGHFVVCDTCAQECSRVVEIFNFNGEFTVYKCPLCSVDSKTLVAPFVT